MSTITEKHIRIRIGLFWKMLASFGLFIGIIVMVSITMIRQFGSEEPRDFEIVSLLQRLDEIITIEQSLTSLYLASPDTINTRRLTFNSFLFHKMADSLLQIIEPGNKYDSLQKLITSHKYYIETLIADIPRPGSNVIWNADAKSIQYNHIINSIKSGLDFIFKLYKPSFIKTTYNYFQQTQDIKKGAQYIFYLSLVISAVIAVLLTRWLIKPIQALQASTQKVGEGQYESVEIKSKISDEITDLTQAFNLMSSKLKQLDEMRMAMMSEISHEMRTPLQVIKAGCYSIIHAKDGPQLTQRQRDAVGMIHQASNRINSFVNSFLDIAKMEAGLMKFNFQLLDLVEMITPLIQEAQLIAQTRQIVLLSHADSIPPMMIDKERMSQAVSNLLSNALKYTPDNGKITVNITKLEIENVDSIGGNKSIKVEVQDSGVGIPEADIGKLFNKFYQAKNVPLVNEKGSGLGLALVKHVAEAHSGRATVKSQVGMGSAFSIILPIKN